MLNKDIATAEFNHTLNCSMIAFRTPNYQGMRTDDGGTRNEEPKLAERGSSKAMIICNIASSDINRRTVVGEIAVQGTD
jgi:hypothetical protein